LSLLGCSASEVAFREGVYNAGRTQNAVKSKAPNRAETMRRFFIMHTVQKS
jgi:hypothetical protein